MIKIKEKYEKDQNKIKNGNLVQKLVQLARNANFTKKNERARSLQKILEREVYKKFREREVYKNANARTANFTGCRGEKR